MFKELKINEQKMIWPKQILILILLIIGLIFILTSKPKLYLNKRDVTLEVLETGSIKVEEIWDINIKDTSTLFITYPVEEKSAFNNIKVSYLENDKWLPMKYNSTISSDGKEVKNSYHSGIFENNFEIAWGTGLANGSGNRKYKIEYIKNMTYNKKNSLNKYLDTAELYHQFSGKYFKIPTKEFYAMIYFPKEVNKDNAKIWGHGTPTGTIFFKDGGVEVKAYNVDQNPMIEARVLFPNEHISLANVNKPEYKYNSIIKEEGYNTAGTATASKFDTDIGFSKITKIIFFAIYSLIYLFALLSSFKKYKKVNNLREENVRQWEAYSGLPQTKLDILSAINIYKPIDLPRFLNTIIMKLSYNKILNIEELDKYDVTKLNKNIELQENLFLSVLQNNMNISDFNNDVLLNILKEKRENDKKETPSITNVNKKKYNELVYILDLAEYKRRKENNELDKDEELILDFLVSSVVKSYIKNTSKTKVEYISKYILELKKENIKMNNSEWEDVEKQLKDKIINNLEELYIEQYQILLNMFYYGDNLLLDFNQKQKVRREELIDKKIISVEKEKMSSGVWISSSIRWFILFVFGIPFAKEIFGTILFNRTMYIFLLILTLCLEAIIFNLNNKILKRVIPALNEEGLNIYYEFEGLKRFLSNSSYISEYDEKSIIIWGEFLVLATYFGITNKVLETLREVHPEIIQEMETIDTFHL